MNHNVKDVKETVKLKESAVNLSWLKILIWLCYGNVRHVRWRFWTVVEIVGYNSHRYDKS